MFRNLTLTLMVFSIFSCQKKQDKSHSEQEIQTTQKIRTDFLEEIPSWLSENNVPAIGIGLIDAGEIKTVFVYGELKEGQNAPKNTIFNVASVTKTVGTLLCLRLIEVGEWDLDTPLFTYWTDPDIAEDPRHKLLTTRHVLTHTTGFPNWRDDLPEGKLAFQNDPGTKYGYSGEGFQYLRNAIEKKFEKPIQDLSDSLIFQPLGMENTWHRWNENIDENQYARWHDGYGELYEGDHKIYWPSLDDDLLTTIEDYSKFGLYVIRKVNRSIAPYDLMVKPQVSIKEGKSMGLGWALITDLSDEEYAIHHGGSDYGVKSEVILLPKSQRGVVVFTNGDNGDYIIQKVINRALNNNTIWDQMYSLDGLPQMVEVDQSTLQSYSGTYTNPDGFEIEITPGKNSLILIGARLPKTILYPESETKFFVKMYDHKIEFLKDNSQAVSELVIFVNGEEWQSATKVK